MDALLKAENAGINFGGLSAVSDFNLTMYNDSLFGLIGPNGAGKTTVFNLLTGIYQPTAGGIVFNGESLLGMPTHKIAKLGMARTFQNIRLFKKLTVLENVMIGFNHQMTYSVLSGVFRLSSYWKEERKVTEKAMELLSVFGLESSAYSRAENLPYGKQRKLEIARALATNPKILLLDEPAAGMNPTETFELMETIKLIRKKFNVAILLIEHDMSFVLGICEHIIVLDYGRIIAAGTPDEIVSDPKVITAYLGEE